MKIGNVGVHKRGPRRSFHSGTSSDLRNYDELYKKYNLDDEEIAFIDAMIRPMD